MAKKISELTSASTLDGTELVPVVQGGVTKQVTVTDLVSGGELPAYDTSETLTTERWIDGKPLYRKVVTGTASADDFNVASGVTGYEYISIVHHSVNTTSGRIYSASGSYFNSGSSEGRLYFNTVNDEIMFMFGSSANSTITGSTYYVVLEYTKTADTASSPVAGVTIAGGDSGWTNLTLLNSWSNLNGDFTLKYKKSGDGTIFITGAVVATSATSTTVCTLPVDLRPMRTMHWPCLTSEDQIAGLRINSDGSVTIGGISNGGTQISPTPGWVTVELSYQIP